MILLEKLDPRVLSVAVKAFFINLFTMQVLPTWASPSITTLNDYRSYSLLDEVDSAIYIIILL